VRRGIAQMLDALDWQDDWVVAQAVTTAEMFCLILAANPASKINIAGSDGILEALNLGTITADVSFEIKGDIMVRIFGRSVPLFVNLIRPSVRRHGLGAAASSPLDYIDLAPYKPQSIPWSDAAED
jgi:hypothetical protein